MKIAVITNSYKSPTELWLWRQIEFMKEHIGYIGILDRVREQQKEDIPIIGLFTEGNVKAALHPFFLSRRLYELEKQFGIDAYYIHYLTNANILKEFIDLTRKKVFVHCHGYDLTFDMKQHQNPTIDYHPGEYIAFTSALPKKIMYITDSEHSKGLLIARGIQPKQVKVLYFGTPVEGINHSKNKNLIKILFLGRLVDFKGPDLTIQAFEKACEMGLNAELYMVGDGPLMVTCQLLKRMSQFSERIKLLGTQPYNIAKNLRAQCHIFTAHNMKGRLSNQEEAYGVSIIEAMGAGLPVVTGRNGGIKETVIHNKTGFLFEPGDLEAHARYLFELGESQERRLIMGEQALQHVLNNYTLEKEKEELLKILNIKQLDKCGKYATIIGPYRYHNFGDDLIGAVITKHLQLQKYNVCIPLLGKENAVWLGTEHSNNHEVAIQKSDVIIIGGGGLLGDAGILPDDYYRELALKAASMGTLTGKKVMTTGIGAGPLKLESSKKLTLEIASLSEKIGVRDSESRIFLEKLGVNNEKIIEGADLALLCSNYLKFEKTQNNKIGVQFDIVSYKDIIENNPKVDEVYNAICRYSYRNSSKVILVSNGNYKSQIYNKSNPNFEMLCYNTFESFLPSLAGLKAIFTSHLHLAITAYSLRIPCFSLYVREKTKRFYNQIGHPERAIDLQFATVEDFERLIKEAEVAIWSDKDEERLQILQKGAKKLLEFVY